MDGYHFQPTSIIIGQPLIFKVADLNIQKFLGYPTQAIQFFNLVIFLQTAKLHLRLGLAHF
jgi:hypothetical protein